MTKEYDIKREEYKAAMERAYSCADNKDGLTIDTNLMFNYWLCEITKHLETVADRLDTNFVSGGR